jgi:hypothetical protein
MVPVKGAIKNALERYSAGRRLLAVRLEYRAIRAAFSSHRAAPEHSDGFGMPLNGQLVRMRTIRALLDTFSPDAIIETGTFLGDTTGFFSGNLIPVYSIEVKFLFHLLARYRLGRHPDVTLIRGDSRRILRMLTRLRRFERPMAYLDAHWWDELPLQAEVTTILGAWEESVIVIDDCQVPDDPGYRFDTYGGVPLSLNLLRVPKSVVCAVPAILSSHETGARRGTLYLGQGSQGASAIHELAERGFVTITQSQSTA